MTNVTMKTQAVQHDGEAGVDLFDDWFDPIGNGFAALSSKSLKQNWMAPFAARDMAGPQGASLAASAIATATAAAS